MDWETNHPFGRGETAVNAIVRFQFSSSKAGGAGELQLIHCITGILDQGSVCSVENLPFMWIVMHIVMTLHHPIYFLCPVCHLIVDFADEVSWKAFANHTR